ncbi:benzoate/H(+) symporter BenE family transporter [Pelagibacterium xiamenense]|uniref:benzoate/H(+) symporter BenE family transporter n=1 Tax=Pelagibacterium xiamenense TaxID=2901140 RepID=UPI001E63EE1D|nr:benzoate/H(+) symporter BenE family transporter [Pelagibacterium xiamenense]MCD7060442.1 benzoate/H(+) symporter BenE family transporter [Pelagibacterium xiamenense]
MTTAATEERATLVQPIFAGILAALVGFASSFAIILQGLISVGATHEQAASGLFALCAGIAVVGITLSLLTRMPVAIAWSTPGAALLIATGAIEGGFEAAVGAFLITAALIVVAGLWRPFGKAVAGIPMPLASAMLAGILFNLCLAPVRAMAEMPALALPIVLAWAITLRIARLWAVPVAVVVTGAIIAFATPLPDGALAEIWPSPVFVVPAFTFDALVGIALPLFIVTMASQNIPGLTVLRSNGYTPAVRPIFVSTGVASGFTAFFGGHTVNLAAITAALCAGPEAHPDTTKRYIAALTTGIAYIFIATGAGFAAAFVAAAPPVLIEAVAGLALLSSLAGALVAAMSDEKTRLPAIVTFVTAASGLSVAGIGAAFWGLVAGGALMALDRFGKPLAKE